VLSEGKGGLFYVRPAGMSFSLLRDPVSNAIVWDSSSRFSARTFIRIMTRIMQIVVARGLPTIGKKKEVGIIL